MNKKEVLKILFQTSQSYKKELCDRNLLFVTVSKHNKIEIIETTFNEDNFLHLTGIQMYEGTKINELDPKSAQEVKGKANNFLTNAYLNVYQKRILNFQKMVKLS